MHRRSLPDVKSVNINHRSSRSEAVSRHFHEAFRKHYGRNLFFSIISFGVYPYKRYKKTRLQVAQALAARKLFFFRALQDHIEAIRKEQTEGDPRQSLNTVFNKLK